MLVQKVNVVGNTKSDDCAWRIAMMHLNSYILLTRSSAEVHYALGLNKFPVCYCPGATK